MSQMIYVVDDDPHVRLSLAALLDALECEFQSFESGDAFLDAAPALEQALVLLDIQMPGRTGLDVLKELRQRSDRVQIVMMTGHGDIPIAVRAMKEGANDFLEKPFQSHQIRQVLDQASKRSETVDPFACLTPKELEVATLLAEGLSNKQVAYDLGNSARTVEAHRAKILSKLGISSIAELVRLQMSR